METVEIWYSEKDIETVYFVDKVVNFSAVNEVRLFHGMKYKDYGKNKRIMKVVIV